MGERGSLAHPSRRSEVQSVGLPGHLQGLAGVREFGRRRDC
jgi:hypothetical protein